MPVSHLHAQSLQGEKRARRKRRKVRSSEWKKRRLSEEQVELLESNFGKERKLKTERKVRLAREVGIDPQQVSVWFQNRRARWKSKQVEQEYHKFKLMHQAVVADKCQLQTQVVKLKERLMEAEERILKLSEGLKGVPNRVSSVNSGSCFSLDSTSQLVPEDGDQELDQLIYIDENTLNKYLVELEDLLGSSNDNYN